MTRCWRRLTVIVAITLLAVPAWGGVCEEWNALFAEIRDFRLDPAVAQQRFIPLHQQLRATYGAIGDGRHVFPIKGYGPECGEQGKGYVPGRYRFFTGNPQGYHPSLDLFIRDRNQDSLDDVTGRPVEIVAYASGVVVGFNDVWNYPSAQRGGKYLWIYDPASDRYAYYAHLERIDVRLGQVVTAGDRLGLLGRTGKNAWKRRSPTHLHFSVLTYDDGRMTPWNPWRSLLGATLLPAATHGG